MAEDGSDVENCWYSVLGVDPISSRQEIRSAYRKKLLKWHPDKMQRSGASADECQKAEVKFQNILLALKVLSDPVERRWIDKCRCDFSSSSDFEINVFPFFRPSVFSGFRFTKKGFYNVYNEVFIKIDMKEKAFAKAYGIDPIGEHDAPTFGDPSSSYRDLNKFYKYWTHFKTVKDFSWRDDFKVSGVQNDKIGRMMESQNKRIRKRERQDFNDIVRVLTNFVRKIDERYSGK